MAIFEAILTEAGIAAVLEAASNQIKINISEIALGAGIEQADGTFIGYEPSRLQQQLMSEQVRIAISQGEIVNNNQLHVSGVVPATNGYELREIGIFVENLNRGQADIETTLFAVYAVAQGMPPLMSGLGDMDALIGFDLLLDTEIPEGTLVIDGQTRLALPLASHQKRGMIKTATITEVRTVLNNDGTLDAPSLLELGSKAITPSSLTVSRLDTPDGAQTAVLAVENGAITRITNDLSITANSTVTGNLSGNLATQLSSLNVTGEADISGAESKGNVTVSNGDISTRSGLYLNGNYRLELAWLNAAPERIQHSGAKSGDRFGASVAISGNSLVVGAPRESSIVNNAGSAYVFQLINGRWLQTAELAASDVQANAEFGTSVAISGDILVVGAPFTSTTEADDVGSAYVFQRASNGWEEVIKLEASDAKANDQFGTSVAISGNTIAVGAPFRNTAEVDAGSVYVFQLGDNGWEEVTELVASDAQANDQFGDAVAMSGNRLVVGARFKQVETASNAGNAYLFESIDDSWTEVKKLQASDAQADDWFGRSVAISGDTVVVGAPFKDNAASNAGNVYLFQLTTIGWIEVAKLQASDAEASAWFGRSVAISGDTVAVKSRAVANNAVGVYVFQLIDNTWLELANLQVSEAELGEEFSKSIAVSGNTLIVGARDEDDVDIGNAVNAGSAYLFTADLSLKFRN